MDSADVRRFEAGRTRLASLAYRLLGSAADAEDVVQDAFLRWQAADHERIRVHEAWLTKVVTNLSLDRLRSAQARRERAVGVWLPEPVFDGDPIIGPLETVEQRESVSLAVLILLERLTPIERAVYVLREAFAYSHAEIAEILDISESASQQHALRARRHAAAERDTARIDPSVARRVVAAFVEAAASGRTDRLVALLTDDAVAVSDGAGLIDRLMYESVPARIAATMRAAFKPTPAKRALVGGSPSVYAAMVNGSPAMVVAFEDRVVGVGVFDLKDGKVGAVHGLAAPARMARLTAQWNRGEHDTPLIESW